MRQTVISLNEGLRRIQKEEKEEVEGEYSTTTIAFWPKIHNPNLIIRKHQTTEGHSLHPVLFKIAKIKKDWKDGKKQTNKKRQGGRKEGSEAGT